MDPIHSSAIEHNSMDLEPLHNSDSTPLTDESSSMTDRDASPTFLWIGDYIKFNALKAKKDLLERAIAGAWHIQVPLGSILGINN
jgi:hypothetical protein